MIQTALWKHQSSTSTLLRFGHGHLDEWTNVPALFQEYSAELGEVPRCNTACHAQRGPASQHRLADPATRRGTQSDQTDTSAQSRRHIRQWERTTALYVSRRSRIVGRRNHIDSAWIELFQGQATNSKYGCSKREAAGPSGSAQSVMMTSYMYCVVS